MEPIRFPRTSRMFMFFLLACLAAGLAPLAVQAQDEKKQDNKEYQVRMSVYPQTEKVELGTFSLRPNTATKQTLFLTRSTIDSVPEVKLVLKSDAGETVLAEASFEAKKESRLVFKKAKDAGEKIILRNPPFELVLKVSKYSFPFTVEVHQPRDFFTVTPLFDAQKNRVKFKIKMKNDAPGPRECPVQLILGPEFEAAKKGVLQNFLTEPGKEVELFADDVKFLKGAVQGTVSIKVDGYERAFNYSTNLKSAPESLDKDDRIAAALRAPLYSLPTEKLPIRLEINGPLHLSHELDVDLDRAGTREQFQVKTYKGLRRQELELGFTKEGDLSWKTSVQDWQDDFNVAGVFNPVWFRISARYKKGGEPKAALLELFPGGNVAKNQVVEANALFARVILDPTPPQNVRFVKLPAEPLVPGKELTLWATADDRDPSRQAPIEKVVFFLGKAPADGKIGPEAVPHEGAYDASEKMYFTKIDLPKNKESLEFFVQFTTVTGLTAMSRTATVRLHTPVAAAKSNKIKGIVLHGDRPQPDVQVGLFEAKTLTRKAVVPTNGKGEFVFENVEPGSYVISAGTTYPKTAGQADVVVPQSKDGKVEVNLRAK